MKNISLAIVMCFGLYFFSFGQSITITGNTLSYNNVGNGFTGPPYSPIYENSYGQFIYFENDIQASGIITALTFYYNGNSLVNSDSLAVYLGLTNINHLDSIKAFKSTVLTPVFQGKLINYNIPGPITITLQTPFTYNGEMNLIVAINELKAGYETSLSDQFLGFGGAGRNRGLCWANTAPWPLNVFDQTPGAYPTSGGGVPNITIWGLTRLSCQSPRFVRFGNITHDSAKITWSPPDSGTTPTGYDIYYSTSRYKPQSSTVTPYISADTNYQSAGLNPSTWYYAWVRSRTASCTSVWTVVDSFQTLCAPVGVPTPSEPFNNQFGVPFPPNCWQKAQGKLSNATPLVYTEAGTQFWRGAPYRWVAGSDSAAIAYIRTDTLKHWLISPPYNLGSLGNTMLEFDVAHTKNGGQVQGVFDADDQFKVLISTDEGQTWSSANTLRSWAATQTIASAGQHVILPLTSYTGMVRIGFYVQSTGGGNLSGSAVPTLFIDNVKISENLPVTLLDFTGTKQNITNLLQWRTATEQNNRGFELQRSANGVAFSTIGFVPAKANGGNSTAELSYQFTDKKPLAAGSYYRLKQVDLDGKFTLSKIVFIKGEAATELVLTSLYPNPTNQLLNAVLQTPIAQRVQLVITDIAGKVVQQQTLQLQKGTNNKVVNVAALAKGTYVVKIVCTNGCEAAVKKFVKE